MVEQLVQQRFQTSFQRFGFELTHVPAQWTIQPRELPVKEAELIKFWSLKNKTGTNVLSLYIWAYPKENGKRLQAGYLSWPCIVTEDQIEELKTVMKKYSKDPSEIGFWDLECPHNFVFDYIGRTVTIEPPNEKNNHPGITIAFLEDTQPDDSMIQEIFGLTAQPDMDQSQRKILASTITSFAAGAIKEPIESEITA